MAKPVNQQDVERIIRRDFAPEDFEEALQLTRGYGVAEWTDPEPARVRVAMLKLADGDLTELRAALWTAQTDYRDVLAYAEYPREMALGYVAGSELSDEEMRTLRDQDRTEYEAWLLRESGGRGSPYR